MKTKFFYAIAGTLFLWHTTIAQSPQKNISASPKDASFESYASIADASGNVYRMGSFSGKTDFDPGPGTYNLTSKSTNDIFIQKSDAAGLLLWAKDLTQSSELNGSFIASRSDAGEKTYVTAPLGTTSDLDQARVADLKPASYSLGDVFILKLDPSGNFIWSNNLESFTKDKTNSLSVDASG